MADWRLEAARKARSFWLTYPRTRGMDRDEVWLAMIDEVAPTIRDEEAERHHGTLGRDDYCECIANSEAIMHNALGDKEAEVLERVLEEVRSITAFDTRNCCPHGAGMAHTPCTSCIMRFVAGRIERIST